MYYKEAEDRFIFCVVEKQRGKIFETEVFMFVDN